MMLCTYNGFNLKVNGEAIYPTDLPRNSLLKIAEKCTLNLITPCLYAEVYMLISERDESLYFEIIEYSKWTTVSYTFSLSKSWECSKVLRYDRDENKTKFRVLDKKDAEFQVLARQAKCERNTQFQADGYQIDHYFDATALTFLTNFGNREG